MKKIILPLVFTCLFWTASEAQNMLTNGSFECFTSMPTSYAQYNRSCGWTNCGGTGSPDYYYNPNFMGPFFDPTPPPHGAGQMGFITRHSSTNFREYVSHSLNTPLIVGQDYEVSFFLSQGGPGNSYGSSSNNIGAHFSVGTLTQTGTGPITSVSPQIEITSILNMMYMDSWQQFTFVFTATTPANQVTFGNFHDDAATSVSAGDLRCVYEIDSIVIQQRIILSVNITNFEAEKVNERQAALNWAVLDPSNEYQRVFVQHATDGIDYKTIGSLRDVQNGSFLDVNPSDGDNYYRLRFVKADGSGSYSEHKVLNFKLKNNRDIQVYPTVIDEYFNVFINTTKHASTVNVQVIDYLGRVLSDKRIALDNGRQLLGFDADYPAGNYLIVVNVDGVRNTYKVLVR